MFTKGPENNYIQIDNGREKTKKCLVYYVVFVCPLIALVCICAKDLYIILNRGEGEVFTTKTFAFEKPLDLSYTNDLPNPPVPDSSSCSGADLKFDCFPRGNVNETTCKARGCCFVNSEGPEPSCFYPSKYASYKFSDIKSFPSGYGYLATMTAQFKTHYPNTVNDITLSISALDENTAHIAFILSKHVKRKNKQPKNFDPKFVIRIDENSTGFTILRKSDNNTLFDSKNIGGFIFTKQFIQISTRLSVKRLYGIGESRNDFPLDTNWNVRTLFNHDAIPFNGNGYGTHPLYMGVEEGGKTHIVFFPKSYSATEFILQPNGLTYRTIGSELEFSISIGESPVDAMTKLKTILPAPFLPPYWSLGFHLSRFGYKDTNHLLSITKQTTDAGIPLDVIWMDIDYMDHRNDFTLSKNFQDLPNFIEKLHLNGMRFIPIVDPGIYNSQGKVNYEPYDLAVKYDVLIKDDRGKPIIGKVWNPESTVFPDFLNPKATIFWNEILTKFHNKVKFDGLWLDMNEVSNFVNGSINGCPNNNLEYPPYIPKIDGGVLNYKTLCMSAKHGSLNHYDIHNIFGSIQVAVTNNVLAKILKTRPFIITRSSYTGFSNSGGHWTGDIMSSWEDMGQSIIDIITFQIFNTPMVGADICGFNGNTTKELCNRWSQLGAFYPFSRNHNTDDAQPQDPVSLGIADSARKALLKRYSLLPYLYTLFWEANKFYLPVVRPTFFIFPQFSKSYNVTTQFYWGDAILIVPVLKEVFTYAKAYIPEGSWYDLITNSEVITEDGQPEVIIPAPLDEIPVLIRGGFIIPMQTPGLNTVSSRKNPINIKVALHWDLKNSEGNATGHFVVDDGVTYAPASIVYWNALTNKTHGYLTSSSNDTNSYQQNLGLIEIFPVAPIKNITANFGKIIFHYNATTNVLLIKDFKIPIVKKFQIDWIY